jgi:hypothetical protein
MIQRCLFWPVLVPDIFPMLLLCPISLQLPQFLRCYTFNDSGYDAVPEGAKEIGEGGCWSTYEIMKSTKHTHWMSVWFWSNCSCFLSPQNDWRETNDPVNHFIILQSRVLHDLYHFKSNVSSYKWLPKDWREVSETIERLISIRRLIPFNYNFFSISFKTSTLIFSQRYVKLKKIN